MTSRRSKYLFKTDFYFDGGTVAALVSTRIYIILYILFILPLWATHFFTKNFATSTIIKRLKFKL